MQQTRFAFVLAFCLACLMPVSDGGPLFAQTTEPAEKTADTDGAGEKEKAEPSAMRRFENRIDDVAGVCVDALVSVFFYEIGQKTWSATEQGAVTDEAGIGELVKSIKGQGVNIEEVDFTLTLPSGSLSETQQKTLQEQLAKAHIKGSRSFKIKSSETDKGTSLEAVSHGLPLVVVWLVIGAIFFTLRMGFINVRGFKHAILVTAGRFDSPGDTGEVSHFQALSAALSATVGLGNIAGVAIAVMTGGPGAVFWMLMAGFLGMSAKFTECTLGQKYRAVRPDGRIMGGAMYYLSNGLKDMGLGGLGKTLGILFAVLCVLASFGGGNAFQVNQSLRAVEQSIPQLKELHWLYGLIMVVMVGIVILGGIRRIAATAEKIVPVMCAVYVAACLWILMSHVSEIPAAFSTILSEAFTPRAGYGGLLGVLILGFKRAAFSNEAGTGSAAIAHSAAKTDYPVREGIVALLEPFIDTIVVCTMTALVIVITGVYDQPEFAHYVAEDNGAGLTSEAMGMEISWFPYVLSVAVVLFAYSTMISWSYYGERCWVFLFGDRASLTYRIIFLVFIFLGSLMSATKVLQLSDLLILGMAFPNILGVVLLSGKVRRDLNEYWAKLKAGEFDQRQ